jgi:hypothetical protein
MTIARTTTSRRRPPPPKDRYRAVARAAKQRRVRRKLPPIVTGIVWGVVLASAALIADTAAVGVGYATGNLGSFVTTLIPAPVPVTDLTVAETTGQVGAAPVLDATPQFTKDSALVVQGIIPSFGRATDRKVSIALNGGKAVVVPIDANGHFALPLNLVDGTNQLIVSLVTPTDVVASTSSTVVLDKAAPPLAVSKPKNGDTVDGTTLTVEGKAEPGATVLVNDRNVIVGQDGSFSDTVSVQAGALPITVIARDRAGNETKSQLAVTVSTKPTLGAAATVGVTLAQPTVKPGGFVTATVGVSNGGFPVAGQLVSLQVGVISIGTATTDAFGHATLSFFAPPNEGIAQVVVLAGNASGSAVLTIAK